VAVSENVTERPDHEEARGVRVVLDTNVWRSSQLLRDPVSAAFLYALERIGGQLGMPEVIEREVFKHGVAMGREARAEIEKHLRTIRTLIGQSPGVELPSDEQFESAVNERLVELESLFHRVPFTVDIALRALDRVDLKHPPSHTGQQYKDSAIWEHCLDLAEEFQVHLVTADKAFYQQNSFQKGLEARLRDELSARGVVVEIHQAMEPLLVHLIGDVAESFDATAAADAIHACILGTLRSSVERDGWVLSDREDAQFEAFVTERIGVLSVAFTLRYGLSSDLLAESGAYATVGGQCIYRPAMQEVAEVKLSVIRTVIPSDGEFEERKHIYAFAETALGGPPPVPHIVRAPLPGGNEFRLIEVHDGVEATDTALPDRKQP
jgi:PIN domain